MHAAATKLCATGEKQAAPRALGISNVILKSLDWVSHIPKVWLESHDTRVDPSREKSRARMRDE